MRVRSQIAANDNRVQSLLQKELQVQAELQKCEENIDIFEQYYLQSSWKTGNLLLGWPMCTYNDVSEFIQRPRTKKTIKPYIEVDYHQKLFSISSLSSKPFDKISRINYMATKQLGQEFRPKISKQNKKKKPLQKGGTKAKLEAKHEMAPKQQQQKGILKPEEQNQIKEEEVDNSESVKSEVDEEEDAESNQEIAQQSQNSQEMIDPEQQIQPKSSIQSKSNNFQELAKKIQRNRQLTSFSVSFQFDDQKRTIELHNQKLCLDDS